MTWVQGLLLGISVLGFLAFALVMLGLIWALDRV